MAISSPAEPQTLSSAARIDGLDVEIKLGGDGTLRWSCGGGERCLNLEAEVLGVEAIGKLKLVVKSFVAGSKAKSCGGRSQTGKRARRDFVVELESEETAGVWFERIRGCIDSFGRPKRLFIFVNPFSGKKSATKVFNTEIKPLLDAANVIYTVQETKYQLHAQEIARSLDLLKYDGIICVSGDGILVEVVNGILQREDWASAIKLPFGIIPAGTGNGIAKSLSHSVGYGNTVSDATFTIIRGNKRSLDVATIVQGETRFFSVLMLTWGLIADIDIESEKYRWMGSARLDFYALLRIMNLRKYNGHVQFIPAPGYETFGEPLKDIDSLSGYFDQKQGEGMGDAELRPSGYVGPIASVDKFEWRSIDGPFVLIWVNNVPWSSESAMPAPEAKFSDGYLDAVIIRDCPKSALLAMMLSIEDGSYVKSPYVTYIKVKAIRLKPGMRIGHATKGGIIDSDGEIIARANRSDGDDKLPMAYGPPIQMAVDQGLATIFCPR